MNTQPSNKSPEMEQALTGMFGFDRRAGIKAGVCCPPPIGCGKAVTGFKDKLSEKEYTISGLCQDCQDKVFDSGEDEGEREDWNPLPQPTKPEQRPAGPNDYATEDGGMICGQSDAQERRYHAYKGNSGKTWLVADQVNAAENVYVTNNPQNTTSSSQGFEGFGGATLKFKLVDGTIFEAHGPWHTEADGLFKDTGIDVRNTHYTFVVLAMARDGWPTIMRDVVYKDKEPVLGAFDRYKELMKQYPQALQYYSKSSGGSSCGPTETWYAQDKAAKAAKEAK